ncbi:SDR family NAD(P)-dependent oxidoreductase [Micromonospora okii]|uniref:SDR family NAD(P)-dependent oxidoreductase n=1 Tax=Micromonospora okii TaxID=1182970 RepID=UPI001E2EEECF|nr:glucose 1-dehydrogenase [Micromonospora okii]
MGVLDTFRLDNKVALVTGGSRGIGAALAVALAEAGADVAITAREPDRAEQALAHLKSLGVRAMALDADVTRPEQVTAAVDRITEELGPIDVLINNAGISFGATAVEMTDDQWQSVLDVNLNGVWRVTQTVGRQMVARGSGTIVNVGSMSAMIVNRPRWQAPYLASKAAVHQLTKALAAEWAPHGVRVNALAPGYILTEASPVDQPEYQPWCVEPAAMKRYGLPEELGPATVFLASDASSFMTGSIVVIDGGYTLF